MTFELEGLSAEELEELIAEAKAWIVKKEDYAVQAAYAEMVQLASGLGLSVDDVILRARRTGNFARPEKTKKPVAPRYRNPNNPSDTWTGRGKAPRWVSALQAQGVTLDSLLIER